MRFDLALGILATFIIGAIFLDDDVNDEIVKKSVKGKKSSKTEEKADD